MLTGLDWVKGTNLAIPLQQNLGLLKQISLRKQIFNFKIYKSEFLNHADHRLQVRPQQQLVSILQLQMFLSVTRPPLSWTNVRVVSHTSRLTSQEYVIFLVTLNKRKNLNASIRRSVSRHAHDQNAPTKCNQMNYEETKNASTFMGDLLHSGIYNF